MSEPEEAAGANMAIDLFDSVQGQEVVLQGEDFWDSLEALWPGALSPTPVGSAERCSSACRAARSGASQPAGQRGAVLLSLAGVLGRPAHRQPHSRRPERVRVQRGSGMFP